MSWIPVGAADAIAPGSRRVFRLRGRAFEVAHAADGTWSALELSCRHQGGDLSDAPRDGSVATCPRHGWRYDLASGECLTDPSRPLRRPRLKVEGGRLWLEPPAAAELAPENS